MKSTISAAAAVFILAAGSAGAQTYTGPVVRYVVGQGASAGLIETPSGEKWVGAQSPCSAVGQNNCASLGRNNPEGTRNSDSFSQLLKDYHREYVEALAAGLSPPSITVDVFGSVYPCVAGAKDPPPNATCAELEGAE